MVTQQEVADYINANITDALSAAEIAALRAKITPALATVLIKLLGDVSFLIEIRDGA
jgi:AraC-like DNA-binding protein